MSDRPGIAVYALTLFLFLIAFNLAALMFHIRPESWGIVAMALLATHRAQEHRHDR